MKARNEPQIVLTIGHSTRTREEFMEILQSHQVTDLIDVRTIPRSRKNPQFNKETLPSSLCEIGIEYTHMKELGGLRHPRQDSTNTAWHNNSFRGYADYMQTPEFQSALERLIEHSNGRRAAIMCAEAVPWRCHRSLIADALVIRGIDVEDIMGPGKRQKHVLRPWAQIQNGIITYVNSESDDKAHK